MNAEEILADLVAFPTIAGTRNDALIDYVRYFLSNHGVSSSVISGPEGDRFNLFATIGPAQEAGYILSGHVDVAPAEEPAWRGDPFTLRAEGDRLIGRGAVDMKGFVAAALSAATELARMKLRSPIHIALSYDEEAGCRGAPHMIAKLATLCATPIGCIVGEPSGMRPVLRHKGKAAIRVTALGQAGHSARSDLGRNAIHALTSVMAAAVGAEEETRERGPKNPHFQPPYSSLQIGRVSGGQALNIIPDHAWAEIEARAIEGVDPIALLAPVFAQVESDDALEAEVVASYPALALPEGSPLAALATTLTGQETVAAVSFGTEAGLYQAAGIPTVVCGPGDIGRAHKPEEYILRDELAAARDMIVKLGRRLEA